MKRYIFINSKGFTLVEILVSLVILSIIVIVFLTFFIQSAKTTASSEDMLDATYIAQSQMEEMYNFGTKVAYSQLTTELDSLGYHFASAEGSINASKEIDHYRINIYLTNPDEDSSLGNVLIEVRNTAGKLRAKMETTIKWKKAEGA